MTRARRSTLFTTLLAVLIAVAASLTLSARAQADDGTPPGAAWVRVGHFVPGLGSTRIDLQPRTGKATSIEMSPSAAYGDVTEYRKVAPGSYTVQVRSTTASGKAAPMLSRSFTVKAGQARTLAVLGDDGAPRLVALVDDLTPPRAGAARVRLLSASATAKTVSVKAVGGPTIASGTVLGQTTGYASVPDGPWTLRLSDGSDSTSEQRVDLASGSVYTAVALDRGGKDVRIKVVTDAAGAASTPKGGARTGGGGTATGSGSSSVGWVGVAALVALVGARVVVRRRASGGAHLR